MIDQFGRTVSETNVYGIGDEKENLMLQPEAAPKIFESGKNLILCYPVGFCNWTLVNETPISEILGDIQDVLLLTIFLTETGCSGNFYSGNCRFGNHFNFISCILGEIYDNALCKGDRCAENGTKRAVRHCFGTRP